MSGKGSRPRPFEVDSEQFKTNWERIFGMKEKKETKEKPEPKQEDSKKTK